MLIVVCDGWTEKPHGRIVLGEKEGTDGISHGMCPACAKALDAEMDAHEEPTLYEQYRKEWPAWDPRD